MGLIATSFGVAAVAAVAVSLLAGRRHSSVLVAAMLLAFWAIANATPAWTDPFVDALGFYVAFFIAYEQPRCRWCFAILAAFSMQLLVHVAFLFDGGSYWRMLALNVIFAAQLVCVCIPGGIVGLRRLRDRWSRLNHPGAVADPARCQEPKTAQRDTAARTLKVAAPSRHRR